MILVDDRARRYDAAVKGVQKIDDIGRINEKIKFDIPFSCGETL